MINRAALYSLLGGTCLFLVFGAAFFRSLIKNGYVANGKWIPPSPGLTRKLLIGACFPVIVGTFFIAISLLGIFMPNTFLALARLVVPHQ
jgi:hypothetical protein